MRRIASSANERFRAVVQLAHSARERKKQGVSVIEGVHLCEAFLEQHGRPREIWIADAAREHGEVTRLLARIDDVPADRISDAMFEQISQLAHGVGLAFLVDTPRPPLPPVIDDDTVYLDRIQDPGNVGSILRTCAAVGAKRVFASPQTAFLWSPKVLRAAMGAHFALELHEEQPWPRIAGRLEIRVAATTIDARTSIYGADLSAPRLWVFGNEGAGIAAEILAGPVERLAIPQRSGVESLNVGVAAALCLYEQARQRGFTGLARSAAPAHPVNPPA